jgi:hypothetical protein
MTEIGADIKLTIINADNIDKMLSASGCFNAQQCEKIKANMGIGAYSPDPKNSKNQLILCERTIERDGKATTERYACIGSFTGTAPNPMLMSAALPVRGNELIPVEFLTQKAMPLLRDPDPKQAKPFGVGFWVDGNYQTLRTPAGAEYFRATPDTGSVNIINSVLSNLRDALEKPPQEAISKERGEPCVTNPFAALLSAPTSNTSVDYDHVYPPRTTVSGAQKSGFSVS